MSKLKNLKSYLRLPYRNIDLNIINSLICDILRGNGNDYTDEQLEIIIKAFCYKLCCSYYLDVEICVLDSDEINKKSKFDNICGLVVGKKVFLEKETLLDIRNINVEILRVVFHEARHIKQKFLIESNDISYATYLSIVEQIIILEMNDQYYKNNYQYLFDEIDARYSAEENLYDYLEANISELIPMFLEDMVDNLNACIDDIEQLKRKVNKRSYNREELFDRIIKRKPYYVMAFPILSFYYNDNGDKIPLSEILCRDFEVPKNVNDVELAQKLVKLDKLIIKNRNGTKTNIELDIKSLESLDTTNEEIIKLRDSLILYLNNIINTQSNGNQLLDIYDMVSNYISNLMIKYKNYKDSIQLGTIKLYSWIESQKKLVRKK